MRFRTRSRNVRTTCTASFARSACRAASGTRPRLALVHVSSEAVRSQSAVVDLGGSVRNFLIRLGVDTGGREYATFAHQMRALSACRMSLGFGTETIDAKPIERFNA